VGWQGFGWCNCGGPRSKAGLPGLLCGMFWCHLTDLVMAAGGSGWGRLEGRTMADIIGRGHAKKTTLGGRTADDDHLLRESDTIIILPVSWVKRNRGNGNRTVWSDSSGEISLP